MEPEAAPKKSSMPGSLRALGALTAGHFLSYVPTLIAAVGGIPLTLAVWGHAIIRAQPTESEFGRWLAKEMNLNAVAAEQTRMVMEGSLVTALIVFGLAHVLSLPWAYAAFRSTRGAAAEQQAKGQRVRFLYMFGALTGICALVTAGAWAWLLLLPVFS